MIQDTFSKSEDNVIVFLVKVKSLSHVFLFVTPWAVMPLRGIFQARVLEWVAIFLDDKKCHGHALNLWQYFC